MFDLNDKSPNILVIGDLIVDHYLWGSCERISPEAPVQIVRVDNESEQTPKFINEITEGQNSLWY